MSGYHAALAALAVALGLFWAWIVVSAIEGRAPTVTADPPAGYSARP